MLSAYREGTSIKDATRLIDFDRELRLLVLDAVERSEIALRTQLGHTIGRVGAFAHEDVAIFVPTFTEAQTATVDGSPRPSRLDEWLARVQDRRDSSDEAFVAHFRARYDDRMPIWALTELLELGHLSRLYSGLRNDLATQEHAPKQFGSYSALAVMAYLISVIDTDSDWAARVADHLRRFPATASLDIRSMGVASGWLDHELWRR